MLKYAQYKHHMNIGTHSGYNRTFVNMFIQSYCTGNSFSEKWFGGTENKSYSSTTIAYSSTTADQRDAR